MFTLDEKIRQCKRRLPIRENEKFVGYVNVIQQRAKRWNESGGVDKFDVPEYSKENLGICREALVEAVDITSLMKSGLRFVQTNFFLMGC